MRGLNVSCGLVSNGAHAMVARQCVALETSETLVVRERSMRETHTAKAVASKSHSTKAHPTKMSEPATSIAAAEVPAEARLRGIRPQTKRAETYNDQEPSCDSARHTFLHCDWSGPGLMTATAIP